MKGCVKMFCQNCNQREATIHLYTNMNGQKGQLDVCQNCYQLIKDSQNRGEIKNNRTPQDPFGFGNLDQFFRSMQNAQNNNNQQSNPNVPPTQNGAGGQPPINKKPDF